MGEPVPTSHSAAGDLASMRSTTVSATTLRLRSRNTKRKIEAGDLVEDQSKEAFQKALDAVNAAQEALWAHGPRSQECQDTLRLAHQLVDIYESITERMTGGPHAADGGFVSEMHCAVESSDSRLQAFDTTGQQAGQPTPGNVSEPASLVCSSSAVGPGLASEEAEEEIPEVDDLVDLIQDEELSE